MAPQPGPGAYDRPGDTACPGASLEWPLRSKADIVSFHSTTSPVRSEVGITSSPSVFARGAGARGVEDYLHPNPEVIAGKDEAQR
jgi:hypothetical protein